MTQDERRADAEKAADMLMSAHAGGTPFAPFAAAFGIVSLADAYAVQRATEVGKRS